MCVCLSLQLNRNTFAGVAFMYFACILCFYSMLPAHRAQQVTENQRQRDTWGRMRVLRTRNVS